MRINYADVAQLAEQLICNQQVIGSSPIIGFYGWIPEWPKGTDCKSAGNAFGGSNPPPSITHGRGPTEGGKGSMGALAASVIKESAEHFPPISDFCVCGFLDA